MFTTQISLKLPACHLKFDFCLLLDSSHIFFNQIVRDVKPALSLSFKLKSATSDQHSASYKPADEQTIVSQQSADQIFLINQP